MPSAGLSPGLCSRGGEQEDQENRAAEVGDGRHRWPAQAADAPAPSWAPLAFCLGDFLTRFFDALLCQEVAKPQ